MPLVTRVRIEFQVDVSVFGKAELLYISIPVTDADEKLFDVIARRIVVGRLAGRAEDARDHVLEVLLRQPGQGERVRRVIDLTTTAISMPDGSPGLMAILVDSSGMAMPVGGGERGIEELVEDAPDIMMRVDAATGSMLYINRAVARLTGYTPEELYQDAGLFARIILPEQRPAWEASFSRLQEISALTFDLTVTAKSGERAVRRRRRGITTTPRRHSSGAVSSTAGSAGVP